ncbi:GIY-YIG nuclease family protein [Nonlabens xiamenensis]
MAHFVYILFSEKLGKYYTGETSDVNRRLNF